jgi:hypothetical protein
MDLGATRDMPAIRATITTDLEMTTTVQDIITQLRQPIPTIQELESLLLPPLVSLRLPVRSSTDCVRLAAPPSARQIATLQATILAYVCPTWEDQSPLIKYYFCPPRSESAGNSGPGVDAIVLGALLALTTPPLLPCTVRLLEQFVRAYSLDKIWDILQSDNYKKTGETRWDEALRAWISIPGKVANAVLKYDPSQNVDIPTLLCSEYVQCRVRRVS